MVASRGLTYCLITAARDEASVIQNTLDSVLAQTVRPVKWVIVDDGSADETAEVVERKARECPWIHLIKRPYRAERNFAGKVEAVNLALEMLRGVDFEILGNLDADVSFEPDYMEFLLARFEEHETLGVAGTPFTQKGGYDSTRDSFEGSEYVAGPCQMFRLRCFLEIGGYTPNPAGGVDWIAVMTARMKGWKVESFPQKRFHHHRSMGTAERGALEALFSYGEKDYYLGGSPIWEVCRVGFRAFKKPYVLGALALASGYFWAAVSRTPRVVSKDLMLFHRREQMRKLNAIFRRILRLRRVDSFEFRSKTD